MNLICSEHDLIKTSARSAAQAERNVCLRRDDQIDQQIQHCSGVLVQLAGALAFRRRSASESFRGKYLHFGVSQFNTVSTGF